MRAGLTATLQIRWARPDARLSQKELVQLAGVSHQQIAKLEELVVARLTTHPRKPRGEDAPSTRLKTRLSNATFDPRAELEWELTPG
jgi:transcriptional regulator with XRE-family HTH domain